jgi:hypothetical protein
MFIPMGNAVMGGLDTTVTYITSHGTNTNQSTYTSPSFSTLTASARRLVIIGFRETNLTANNSPPSSCTVTPNVGSAVAASLIEQDPPGAISTGFRQIWAAAVPTGTTATASIVRAANMTGQVFLVWIGEDLRSFTAIDSITGTTADPSTGTLTTAGPGFAIGMGFATSASGFAWTNLTEDVDSTLTTISFTGASRNKVGATSVAIELDTNVNCQLLAASWS